MRKKDPHRYAELSRLAIRGEHNQAQLAAHFGVTKQRVSKMLKDSGIVWTRTPRALAPYDDGNGYTVLPGGKPEHIAVVERVFGRPLPAGAQVHHANRNRADNRNCNLVICEDAAYHALLHVRLRALDACGNPNFRKCLYCKTWDHPSNMTVKASSAQHKECYNKYMRQRTARVRARVN